MNENTANPATILLYDRTLSNKHASPVTEFGQDLDQIIQRLFDTLGSCGGVGLAAPQIGVFLRVAVVSYPDAQFVMVNPEILATEGEVLDWEACLSIPGASASGHILKNRARVVRPTKLKLRAQDSEGAVHIEDFEGFVPRIICHEVEHLDGIFFIHHLEPMMRSMVLSKLHRFEKWNKVREVGA